MAADKTLYMLFILVPLCFIVISGCASAPGGNITKIPMTAGNDSIAMGSGDALYINHTRVAMIESMYFDNGTKVIQTRGYGILHSPVSSWSSVRDRFYYSLGGKDYTFTLLAVDNSHDNSDARFILMNGSESPFNFHRMSIDHVYGNGTVDLHYQNRSVTLKPCERWATEMRNTEQVRPSADNRSIYNITYSVRDTIINHGVVNNTLISYAQR